MGEQVGRYFVTSEFSFHARHCGCEGLLLVGDAFAFLDPIFSRVDVCLKSGVLAGEAAHKALVARNFALRNLSPTRITSAAAWRTCASWSMPFTIRNFL